MVKGLYTAYTGMLNEQNRMDTLTNNLANVTTVGFKKEGTTSQAFDEVLTLKIKDSTVGYNNVQRVGGNSRGVKIGENYTDWSQGSLRITDNTYDLALAGEGFFAIETTSKSGETSTVYTRAGEFTLNEQGYLVTNDGDYVLDVNNKRIQLDTHKDTVIDRLGVISQDGQQVAQIQVADFADYNYLQKTAEVYYVPIEGAELTKGTAEIYSGYLEQANVSTVTEMVNLITISRQYESNQKIMQTIDGSLDIAVNQLGKI